EDAFIIYINPLKKGKVEAIDQRFSPDFLDVREEDLEFNFDVAVKGQAYVADQDLILHLDIKTRGTIPCSICNEPVDVDVELKGFYYVEPLINIKSGVFDMREPIREAVLLETPSFIECHQGKCPQRKNIEKFLSHPGEERESGEEVGDYHPFKNLILEEEE
ncbi:MAG TPA: hypothetical protein VIH61_03940, partial [Waddliaceae bacterium]